MDLFQADMSIDQSEVALIDWNTPIMIKNNERDCINNNPFDIMESKVFNSFDLVFNETFKKRVSPCGNIKSPLKKFESIPLLKSISSTDISGVVNILERFKEDKSNDHTKLLVCLDDEVVDQSKENCTQVLIKDNNLIKNEENKIESNLTVDHNNEISDIIKRSLCSEEEKKQFIEKTRQRIQMLIEKAKKDHEEQYTQKSLFRAQLCNHNSSFNKSDCLFNRGFIQSGYNCYNDSSNETPKKTARRNVSNSLNFFSKIQESSFDLNSLKPEWISNSFSDMDDFMDTQTNDKLGTIELTKNNNNNGVDKSKILDCTGIIESKPNACRVLQFKQNKNSFIANTPLQKTVQHLKDQEIKENIRSFNSFSFQPVASSTPTENNMMECKTPSTIKSFISSDISRQKMLNFANCPSSPTNITKYKSKNLTSNVDGSKLSLSNVSHSVTPPNKRSKTTIVLYGGTDERKLKMVENLESFKMNKSKSLSKISMMPKPVSLDINKRSSLPVPKKFSNSISMPFKKKENMKLQ